jgi:hypothetical protein
VTILWFLSPPLMELRDYFPSSRPTQSNTPPSPHNATIDKLIVVFSQRSMLRLQQNQPKKLVGGWDWQLAVVSWGWQLAVVSWDWQFVAVHEESPLLVDAA